MRLPLTGAVIPRSVNKWVWHGFPTRVSAGKARVTNPSHISDIQGDRRYPETSVFNDVYPWFYSLVAHDQSTNFTDHADFDPAGNLESFLKSVPARWVVYLLSDAGGQPVQLLCVKNLRASLKRRLGGDEPVGPTRKVNYRDVVRCVSWRRVDSIFEADWQYFEAARVLFPDTYGGMSGFRKTWWICVNSHATHPRYTRTNDPTDATANHFGPVGEKHAAEKLVQQIESLFDLCRDYRILTQSPNAGPCAWKQMNRCVGPCDGTISLEAYRQLIAHSTQVLADPAAAIEQETQRMRKAAEALAFESAAGIKQFVEGLAQLTKGPARHLRRLEQFRYLAVQPGPKSGQVKLFLVGPGRIDEVAGLIDAPGRASDLLRYILALDATPHPAINEAAAERMSVVAAQLFSARDRGVFIHLDDLTDRTLTRAVKMLLKQDIDPVSEDDEGATRALRAVDG